MSKTTEELRARSEVEKRSAAVSKSLKKAVEHRKRSKALSDMADNEDWLDGKSEDNK